MVLATTAIYTDCHPLPLHDPLPISEPVVIPVEAYISEDYARAERDKLWRKCWLQAGRVEDLPETGSYITYEILDDSVLIVRIAEGEAANGAEIGRAHV